MKNLTLCLMLILLGACGGGAADKPGPKPNPPDPQPSVSNPLEGTTWSASLKGVDAKGNPVEVQGTITFGKDGAYTEDWGANGGKMEGTYAVNGKILTINGDVTFKGSGDFEVASDGKTLSMIDTDKNRITFSKNGGSEPDDPEPDEPIQDNSNPLKGTTWKGSFDGYKNNQPVVVTLTITFAADGTYTENWEEEKMAGNYIVNEENLTLTGDVGFAGSGEFTISADRKTLTFANETFSLVSGSPGPNPEPDPEPKPDDPKPGTKQLTALEDSLVGMWYRYHRTDGDRHNKGEYLLFKSDRTMCYWEEEDGENEREDYSEYNNWEISNPTAMNNIFNIRIVDNLSFTYDFVKGVVYPSGFASLAYGKNNGMFEDCE